jgi:DNA-binding Lrp family transcriptional regulator
MRGVGATWAAIGQRLGLSRNTVIERGRRLRAEAPVRPVVVKEYDMLEDPNRGPLPAGHPLTWGLLTNDPYPVGDEA